MQTIVRNRCEALRCEVRNNYLSDPYDPPQWLGAAGGIVADTPERGASRVCEGRCTSSRWGGSDSVYVCWFMCVLGKFPVRFQFYRTKCQSRKLRHVMFCNICIKNPNLRKILIFPRFIGSFGCKKPTAASRGDAVGFDSICGMHVGLQGFNCLVLCGFINSIPHKVAVTVSEILTQTDL